MTLYAEVEKQRPANEISSLLVLPNCSFCQTAHVPACLGLVYWLIWAGVSAVHVPGCFGCLGVPHVPAGLACIHVPHVPAGLMCPPVSPVLKPSEEAFEAME